MAASVTSLITAGGVCQQRGKHGNAIHSTKGNKKHGLHAAVPMLVLKGIHAEIGHRGVFPGGGPGNIGVNPSENVLGNPVGVLLTTDNTLRKLFQLWCEHDVRRLLSEIRRQLWADFGRGHR